jgi:hypothetical protein
MIEWDRLQKVNTETNKSHVYMEKNSHSFKIQGRRLGGGYRDLNSYMLPARTCHKRIGFTNKETVFTVTLSHVAELVSTPALQSAGLGFDYRLKVRDY